MPALTQNQFRKLRSRGQIAPISQIGGNFNIKDAYWHDGQYWGMVPSPYAGRTLTYDPATNPSGSIGISRSPLTGSSLQAMQQAAAQGNPYAQQYLQQYGGVTAQTQPQPQTPQASLPMTPTGFAQSVMSGQPISGNLLGQMMSQPQSGAPMQVLNQGQLGLHNWPTYNQPPQIPWTDPYRGLSDEARRILEQRQQGQQQRQTQTPVQPITASSNLGPPLGSQAYQQMYGTAGQQPTQQSASTSLLQRNLQLAASRGQTIGSGGNAWMQQPTGQPAGRTQATGGAPSPVPQPGPGQLPTPIGMSGGDPRLPPNYIYPRMVSQNMLTGQLADQYQQPFPSNQFPGIQPSTAGFAGTPGIPVYDPVTGQFNPASGYLGPPVQAPPGWQPRRPEDTVTPQIQSQPPGGIGGIVVPGSFPQGQFQAPIGIPNDLLYATVPQPGQQFNQGQLQQQTNQILGNFLGQPQGGGGGFFPQTAPPPRTGRQLPISIPGDSSGQITSQAGGIYQDLTAQMTPQAINELNRQLQADPSRAYPLLLEKQQRAKFGFQGVSTASRLTEMSDQDLQNWYQGYRQALETGKQPETLVDGQRMTTLAENELRSRQLIPNTQMPLSRLQPEIDNASLPQMLAFQAALRDAKEKAGTNWNKADEEILRIVNRKLARGRDEQPEKFGTGSELFQRLMPWADAAFSQLAPGDGLRGGIQLGGQPQFPTTQPPIGQTPLGVDPYFNALFGGAGGGLGGGLGGIPTGGLGGGIGGGLGVGSVSTPPFATDPYLQALFANPDFQFDPLGGLGGTNLFNIPPLEPPVIPDTTANDTNLQEFIDAFNFDFGDVGTDGASTGGGALGTGNFPLTAVATPQIPVENIITARQQQQLLNNALAQNTTAYQSQLQQARESMAGRGLAPTSPAMQDINARAALNRSLADVAAMTNIPISTQQANAEYMLQALMENAKQRGLDISTFSALINAQTGLLSPLLGAIVGVL